MNTLTKITVIRTTLNDYFTYFVGFFYSTHVAFANIKGAGLMTFTAHRQQGALRLQDSRSCHVVHLFTVTDMNCTL